MRTGWLATFLIAAAITLVSPGNAFPKVKVFLDESRTDYVMADKLDCKVYEGRSGLTVGFKADFYVFSIGPQITLGRKDSIQWDKSVHSLLAGYKELCTRFNSGAITLKEYNERIERLDGLAAEMMEFQRRVYRQVKEESKEAFGELDKETRAAERQSPEDVSRKLEEIGSRIEDLGL